MEEVPKSGERCDANYEPGRDSITQELVDQSNSNAQHSPDKCSNERIRQHKLQRDKTIREELHMYSKELTQRVNEKLNGNETENGEVKWSNILYV